MHYLLYLFIVLFTQLLINCEQISPKVEVCGNADLIGHGIDLSALDSTTWSLTTENKVRVDYNISVCGPLNTSLDHKCDKSYICRHNRDNNQVIGYEPKSMEMESISGSNTQSVIVVFEGPECDENHINYTIKMRFTCGPHLEYPQHFMDTKCVTHLFWRTYAVCKEKPTYDEVKCYVNDDQGFRHDLTPLIKPKGVGYKVLSQDQEFYINVCSNVSGLCSENGTGACLKTGENQYTKVGDYRFGNIEFKRKNGAVSHDHVQMTYKTKSKAACSNGNANYTSVTTIRFICPPKHQKRNNDLLDRNPKLVSNLDCDYQIDWFTEYACPLNTIEVSATKCQLTEDVQGIDFDLKSLMKSNEYYKIENIALNGTKSQSRYDIHFNVCGGLGKEYKCGKNDWEVNAVCLKSRDNPSEDKVIGLTKDGSLKLVDNRLLLEYKSNDAKCKFGGIPIAETTIIEFLCDDTKGFEYKGKPEFISFEDCTYYIIWKTSVVCPVISANTSCMASFKNLTFDLSLLKKGYGSEPWTASVSQTLPWSRHAKNEKDTIFLNVCGVVPKTEQTKSCDERSSACMTIGDSNTTISLGRFMSPPQYNEDIKAIELIYTNGFDQRRNKKIKSKIILRCKAGSFNSEPTLVDVDDETGTYHFEWDTWAACPINSFVGTDCKVYDSFLGYTFDLNPLHTTTPYVVKDIENRYEFQISVCGELKSEQCDDKSITTAIGPFGVCQVELDDANRSFSLGKVNKNITYWNGVINMTFSDGTPYRNPEKTPRKSHIAFICDPNVDKGQPEYDGERNRSYFFRWYTSLACPHTPKSVHCVWENGSHVLDLTPLAMTSGNHFTVGLPAAQSTHPSIYYINICRPLNQIHDNHMSIEKCGADSAACRFVLDANKTVLNLGKATQPPFRGFDGSISMIYEDGSPCPTNPKKNIKTLIKFECDPNSDLSNPIVHEPGSDLTDNEECVYLFEWRTSAVCDVIKPTIIETNSCVFTDAITKLTADLTPLKRNLSEQPYKVAVRQNQATYELNICGSSTAQSSEQCSNSAVCYQSNIDSQTRISYGLLSSSTFFYDGTDLRLRYHNGSKCTAHNDTRMMSSEIIFKCNPESKHTEPKLHSSHACVAVFEWETDLVCNLKPQKCSIIENNQFYNLRQLSSLSHAWNTTDNKGNIYYLNVCLKLPATVQCKGVNAASCKCTNQSNHLECSDSLGDPSDHELQVISNGTLRLTYKNGEDCGHDLKAQTQITFKCGQNVGNPKFIEFDEKKCVYKFEWNSMMACPVTDIHDILLPEKNGFLHDNRLDIFINVSPLIGKNFTAEEHRLTNDNKADEYKYIINLSSSPLSTSSKCSKAAVCQTKADGFQRDIGTIDSIKYYLRGHELQIVLKSLTNTCGRNKNKNVTTIFRLFCSSSSGIGNPVFMYESDDCDYTFNWATSQVCPTEFVDKTQFDTIIREQSTHTPETVEEIKPESRSKIWVGIVIVVVFVLTLTVLVAYKQRVRQSLMFRFRRLFGPETSNHTFHYHQLASHEKDRQREEVVFISQNDAQNRNTIAAQPSGPVPYYSIYDDSDVDLLT